jgi:ketosteroid isomerase-like protein
MQRSDQTATAETLWRAIERRDWDAAAACLHEEYVQEWPQSGERIVGRDDALAINRNFPGGVPRMTLRRAVGQGDLVATEVELRYADGSFYHGVSILEFRDGKVVRETDYFAQPFQAPQWRAQWVRRM